MRNKFWPKTRSVNKQINWELKKLAGPLHIWKYAKHPTWFLWKQELFSHFNWSILDGKPFSFWKENTSDSRCSYLNCSLVEANIIYALCAGPVRHQMTSLSFLTSLPCEKLPVDGSDVGESCGGDLPGDSPVPDPTHHHQPHQSVLREVPRHPSMSET